MSDVVDAAKLPGTFSLESFLNEIAYPEESVTVFTHARAVNELLKLRDQYDAVNGEAAELDNRLKKKSPRTVGAASPEDESSLLRTALSDRLVELQDQIDELDEQVAKSALTIKLRGLPPHVVDNVTKKHYTDPTKDYSGSPEEELRDYELMSSTIVSITDSEGNLVEGAITPDSVRALRGSLLSNEYIRFVKAVANVNLNGALFDMATDASFLSRRSNLAG